MSDKVYEKEQPITQANTLMKRYDRLVAVDAVSFNVHKGEIFGILGPNGAGKTTTIEILEGMLAPDSGTATVVGIDVTKEPQKVKALIGVQLQSSSFFDKLNIKEILQVFGSLYGHRIHSTQLLKKVQLAEKSKSLFRELSGGQKQRFSIAVALVNDPSLLFLDEPTTGLDPQARQHMWALIKDMQARDKTIVLTTHYMEEAEELCERIAIMDAGQIVALDTPNNLISALLDRGFSKKQITKAANLEDVFLDLTGRKLREE